MIIDFFDKQNKKYDYELAVLKTADGYSIDCDVSVSDKYSLKHNFIFTISSAAELIKNEGSGAFKIALELLEKSEEFISLGKNNQLLNALRCLCDTDNKQLEILKMIQCFKLVQCFDVPGIHRVRCRLEPNYTLEHYLLDEMSFPDSLIPEAYRCQLLNVVMSKPCRLGANTVDRRLIQKSSTGVLLDPFTRHALLEITLDQALSDEIALFIKKVQFLYYFLTDELNKYERFKWILFDAQVSYEAFKAHIRPSPVHGFFTSAASIGLTEKSNGPEKLNSCLTDVFELFVQHDIKEINPSGQHFEKLIRKMAAAGDAYGLGLLLSNPIVDVVHFNIAAHGNDSHRTALHWLVIKANQKAHDNSQIEQYRDCYGLLRQHVSEDIQDIYKKTARDYDEQGLIFVSEHLQLI